jgi:Family of unknown function (DUF6186)
MTSHDVTVAGYLLVALAVVGLEAAAGRGAGGVASIRQVVARVTVTRSGRLGVLVAWAWLGMHLFAR